MARKSKEHAKGGSKSKGTDYPDERHARAASVKPVLIGETGFTEHYAKATKDTIYVRSIKKDVSEHTVMDMFSQWGDVAECRLMIGEVRNIRGNQNKRKPKFQKYGFVRFSHPLPDRLPRLNGLNQIVDDSLDLEPNILDPRSRTELKEIIQLVSPKYLENSSRSQQDEDGEPEEEPPQQREQDRGWSLPFYLMMLVLPFYILKWIALYIVWPIIKFVLMLKYGVWYLLGKRIITAAASGDTRTLVQEVGQSAGWAGGWGWWIFMKIIGRYFISENNQQAQHNNRRRRAA